MALGIVATLMAILLPAIQKARASAARLRCSNNLKQLALGLHHYHDAKLKFPPGVNSARPGQQFPRMSWLAQVLPYVDQSPLWEQTIAAYDFQPVPYVDPPHLGFATPMRAFACPADSRTHEPQATHQGLRVALTSYLGVLGTAYNAPDGILFVDSGVRIADITDGTSNTLLLGERPPSPDFWYGWWYAGYGQAGTGSCDMLLGVRERNFGDVYVSACPPGPYHFSPGRFDNQADLFHFWSPHDGGANFAFADASVHFMTYDADDILPALATRAGGENTRSP